MHPAIAKLSTTTMRIMLARHSSRHLSSLGAQVKGRSIASTWMAASSFSSFSSTPFATMDSLSSSNSKKTWLDDGLKFGCTACGKCCKGKTTNVFLNKTEIQMLASVLEKEDVNEFANEYTEPRKAMSGESLTSLKNKDGACILFNKSTNKCSVYEARPLQCRTYPFWKPNMIGSAEWTAEASRCEGINAKDAPIIEKAEIVENLILSEIHAKGTGPSWDYEAMRELLVHKEEIESWTDSFFTMHRSETLYEDNLLRVVETTVPSFVRDVEDSKVEGDDENDEEFDDIVSQTKFETTRRLEFVNSSLYSQTEMTVLDVFDDNAGTEGRQVDHTKLMMTSHEIMSGITELSLDFNNPIGPKRVAVIGAGGCAIPSYLISLVKRYLPRDQQDFLQIAAVEPEEAVLRVAKEFFEADLDSPHMKSYVMDGKSFLVANRDNIKLKGEDDNLNSFFINALFDVIIVDAYESSKHNGEEVRSAPPSSMLEDPSLYLSSLRTNGILIVNIHGDAKWREHVRLHFVGGEFIDEPIVLAVKQPGQSSVDTSNFILLTAGKKDATKLTSVIQELISSKNSSKSDESEIKK